MFQSHCREVPDLPNAEEDIPQSAMVNTIYQYWHTVVLDIFLMDECLRRLRYLMISKIIYLIFLFG